MRRFSPVSLLVLALVPIPVLASPSPAPSPLSPSSAAFYPHAVTTVHSVRVDGRTIRYDATAGTILLRDRKGAPTARMFYIAYTERGVRHPSRRPLTFAYNGGPGFASALVDIGGFGPRRIVWPAPGDTRAYAPPYRLIPNPATLLRATDLVFVDAVGTGYSRIVGAGKPSQFYGVNADGRAFAQFVIRYLTKTGRWNSPKFLLGESYGTTRSAVLGNDLVNDGVYLNGIVLCSTVLNFPTINFAPGNELPYELYLPSYAAVAWYHHRLNPRPKNLAVFVRRVERFAEGPYARALFAGDTLPHTEAVRLAAVLARDTGIPARTWLKAHLRLTLPVFMRLVLGSRERQTGRFDARFSLPILQPMLGIPGASDQGATTSAIWGALTSTFVTYVRRDLHYRTDLLYRQNSNRVFRAWNWSYVPPLHETDEDVGTMADVNVAPALTRAMVNDPALHVLSENGYFDLATPFFATVYTLHHLRLPAALRHHVVIQYNPSGHMLYLNPKALPSLVRRIDAFIEEASR
jgi:carboxypeptidase C (cathepsin A)